MLLINKNPVPWFKFPAGEVQVRLPDLSEEYELQLIWKPTCSDDVMILWLTLMALDENGYMREKQIFLEILYMPYGRQDRACNAGEATAINMIRHILKPYSEIIVSVWDPHSGKSLFNSEYIHNSASELLAGAEHAKRIDMTQYDFLCAPDKGAFIRVFNAAIHFKIPMLHANKKRNPVDGSISYDSNDMKVTDTDKNLDQAGRILIIDDICDGGTTFIKLAECLKQFNPTSIDLYVTTGIFSKGVDILRPWINHVYCHHVLHDELFPESDYLTIFDLWRQK